MHNPHIMGYLESLARRGKVAMMLGGPPCRTVSAARLRDDDGPRAVRGRGSEDRWGLRRNTVQEKTLCDGDSALWLKMLWLTVLGRYANPEMETTIEQPQDPEEWQAPWRPRPDFGFASYLTWPETFMAMEIGGQMESKFDQGRFGHAYCKPTTLLTTSGGYYCRDDEGRFLRSIVVVIPKQQATTAQALEDEMRRLHNNPVHFYKVVKEAVGIKVEMNNQERAETFLGELRTSRRRTKKLIWGEIQTTFLDQWRSPDFHKVDSTRNLMVQRTSLKRFECMGNQRR